MFKPQRGAIVSARYAVKHTNGQEGESTMYKPYTVALQAPGSAGKGRGRSAKVEVNGDLSQPAFQGDARLCR